MPARPGAGTPNGEHMPRKTERRHRQGEEFRRRILEATLAIAAERGYDGTSLGLVTERAGLPASSVYWHFGSKDELLAEAVARDPELTERLARFQMATMDGLYIGLRADPGWDREAVVELLAAGLHAAVTRVLPVRA